MATRVQFNEALSGSPAAARRLTTVAVAAAAVLAAHAATRDGLAGLHAVLLVLAAGAGLGWSLLAPGPRVTYACLVVVAGAGGLLALATDDRDGVAAAVLFAAVAAGGAAQRFALGPALVVAGIATAALVADVAHTPAAPVFAALIVPATVATGIARRQDATRAEVAEQLLAEAQRTREEQARAAALAERVRVAREVHDVLAHALTALAISLETAEVLLAERQDADGALGQVRRARGLAVEGLTETRSAVAALRGAPVGLPESLGRLLHDYRADTAAEATLVTTGDRRDVGAESSQALWRIAQEALTNVRRHAPGAPVRAALTYGPDAVRLSIDNALTGAVVGPSPGGGYGLRGMRERAGACGGTVRARPVDGSWRVDVEVPA